MLVKEGGGSMEVGALNANSCTSWHLFGCTSQVPVTGSAVHVCTMQNRAVSGFRRCLVRKRMRLRKEQEHRGAVEESSKYREAALYLYASRSKKKTLSKLFKHKNFTSRFNPTAVKKF